MYLERLCGGFAVTLAAGLVYVSGVRGFALLVSMAHHWAGAITSAAAGN